VAEARLQKAASNSQGWSVTGCFDGDGYVWRAWVGSEMWSGWCAEKAAAERAASRKLDDLIATARRQRMRLVPDLSPSGEGER